MRRKGLEMRGGRCERWKRKSELELDVDCRWMDNGRSLKDGWINAF